MDNYRPEDNMQNSPQFNQFDYSGNQGYNQYNYNANQGYGQTGYNTGYGQDAGYDPYGYNTMNQGFEAGDSVPVIQRLTKTMTSELMQYSYLFMVVALFITAGAALTTSWEVALRMLTGVNYIILFVAELAIVFAAQAAIKKNHAIIAGVLFAAYSYLTGMLFSIFFMIYTGGSLAAVFFICAGMFAIMSVYGMVTKRDLTTLGSICMMGLFGLIIAGIVNMVFLKSSMFELITSVIGVFVFVGLTAYDVKKAKRLSEAADSENTMALAMYCALELYLDFINLFLRLLSIMGKRK